MALVGLMTGTARRLYVSGTAESTFGAGASLSHILEHFLEGTHLDVTNDIVKGNGWTAGVATDLSSRGLPLGFSMAGELQIPASEPAVPLLLHKCIGVETKAGSTGAYTHTSAMALLPDYLPGMAVENHLSTATANTGYDVLHWGVNVDRFKLSVGATGVAQITAGLIGSGITSTATTQTDSGLVKPTSFLTKGMAKVIMAPVSTPGTSTWDGNYAVGTTVGTWGDIVLGAGEVDISNYVESFEFEVANGGAAERQCGVGSTSGLYMGAAFPKSRSVTLSMKVKQGTPLATWWKARSIATYALPVEYTFAISFSSITANNGIAIIFPLCSLENNPSASGTGVLAPTYTWDCKATYTGTAYGAIASYAVNTDNIDYA